MTRIGGTHRALTRGAACRLGSGSPPGAGIASVALVLVALTAVSAWSATPRKAVVDAYFGTQVLDEYRWLETGDDPDVQRWSDEQNARARTWLDRRSGRPQIERRLTELLADEAPAWSGITERRGVLFAFKHQPPKAQPMLVTLASIETAVGERVLVDPLALDPSGATTIDFAVPALDGHHVAVSLSRKGSERGDVHVFAVSDGRERAEDMVPAVNTGTAGGSLAWTGDGFYYTRHPLERERPKEDLGFYQQVYFHRLGTPTRSDTYEIGRDFLRIAESFLATSPDGRWAADLVQKGDGGEFELFVRAPEGAWTRVAGYADRVVKAQFGADNALYLLSRKNAPRGQVLRLPLVMGGLGLGQATVVVPQDEAAIEDMVPTRTRLYTLEQIGGPSRLRQFDLNGRPLPAIAVPAVTALADVEPVGGADDVLVRVTGYLAPASTARFRASSGRLEPTPYAGRSPADLTPYEVVRAECLSRDGTRIPMNIVRRKGLRLDGSHRVLLTGYGGFGISIAPRFNRALPIWLEAGGVFVEANLRGGGEFGEIWHQQGMLRNKQNVFDDFLACARWLVARRYTTPRRLAIEGGSNGGLLMGAALTQAPAAFRAVVAHVGYFDMLRYETAPNGVFNTTEYGTVQDPADFRVLAAYSPYHRVQARVQYPAILFMTGKNDPRVDPFHSRKMVARLEASGTGQPVLLRTSDTGHGMGTPLTERIAQATDVYAFLFDRLGMRLPQPAAAPPRGAGTPIR